MIKNYIFDFGNVFAEFIPEKLCAPYVEEGEGKKRIVDAVFSREYWDKLDSGEYDDNEAKAEIKKRLSEDEGELALRIFDAWIGNMAPIDGMRELLSEIKKTDKKLYLLSNISKDFAKTYHNYPWISELFEKFDGLVFSGTIGMIKPSPEIFGYVLDKFGLKAEESLFIDDSLQNIKGAESIGIKGYLFDGDADKLRIYLMQQEDEK